MKTNRKNLCVVMSAGGTGGHVIPALSIAKELISHGHSVEWIGGRRLEAQLVPKANIPLHQINQTGVRRSGLVSWLMVPFSLLIAVRLAYRQLQKIRPDFVVGMGGYVTVPVGIACKLLHIPFILHEQNAIPGLSNRLLRPLAHHCFSGFPDTFKQKSVTVIGNPVRPSLAQVPPYEGPHSSFNILIFGGSLGAQSLNQIVPKALCLIPPSRSLSIVHQTGEVSLQFAKEAYQHCLHEWRLETFIDDMPSHYAQADLIIARSGALTVSEIATVGRAAILIPYPYAVDDHQTANAMHLVSHGAALCIQQKELSSENLAELIIHFLDYPEKLIQIAQAARQKTHQYALETMVNYLENFNLES